MQSLSIVRLPMIGLACLLLTLGLMASFFLQKPFEAGRWKRYYWLVLTQFLFLPATAALGVVYRVSTDPTQPRPTVNPIGDWGINILFLLSLALNVFWVYRMKGVRWFAFCFVSLQQLFLFGAAFVAGMSVTGDWL
jgi:hypothetical protein